MEVWCSPFTCYQCLKRLPQRMYWCSLGTTPSASSWRGRNVGFGMDLLSPGYRHGSSWSSPSPASVHWLKVIQLIATHHLCLHLHLLSWSTVSVNTFLTPVSATLPQLCDLPSLHYHCHLIRIFDLLGKYQDSMDFTQVRLRLSVTSNRK